MTMLVPAPSASPSDTGFDTYLGAARHRYLGEGHRRVTTDVSPLHRIDDAAFEGTAHIAYPVDWSQKAGADRSPHLSTVDAIRVAGRIHASLVASGSSLLARFPFERALHVRAGARPWEALDDVPIRTELVALPNTAGVRLEHRIGSLKVESEWVESAQPHVVDEQWEAGQASNISLNGEAQVHCVYQRRNPHVSLMSFLEAMMLTAQMSQVALYGGDASRRDQSGNMWMRRASFVRHVANVRRAAPTSVTLHDRRSVTIEGRSIDLAEVHAANVFGIQVTASLASGS